MLRGMCGVELKGSKRIKNWEMTLALNEATY